MSKTTTDYSAKNLELIEGLAHVRKRPGMYIGSTGLGGLHHLIYEIVDNSVDEAMAGHCDEIIVEVDKDQWVTVTDNGRGIPTDVHPKTGISGLQLVLTNLGAGGKWNAEDGGYKVSGGLHGVGSSVVNAVSRQMKAVVHREGFEFTQDYKIGVPGGPVKKGKKVTDTGTAIAFLFDDKIFNKGVKYDRDTIERRLREIAYLNPGLKFTLKFYGHKDESFVAKGGLSDYMKALAGERENVKPVHKAPLLFSGEVTEDVEIDGQKKKETIMIDAAFFWTDAQNESAYSFVNSINTREGGTHLSGANSAIRKALQEVGQEMNRFKAKDEAFTQDDTREGLFYAIAVRVSEPQFEGQTKMKLGNAAVSRQVDKFLTDALKEWMLAKANKDEADRIVDRVIEARDGRVAARKAKAGIKDKRKLGSLAGKLAPAISKDATKTEIFIVEGDSAGGGMHAKRDKTYQAILPLKGKIKNSERDKDPLEAEGIQLLVAALGGSIDVVTVEVMEKGKIKKKVKRVVDLSEPNYSKIILTCDADADGGHIVTLLLTFFLRFAPHLLKEGKVYISELPLFRVKHKTLGDLYLLTQAELDKHEKSGKLRTRTDGSTDIQRFKGLGEMDPDELGVLALSKETRILRQVKIGDIAEAEHMTTLLMGSRADKRMEYIQEHALDVEVII